MFKVVSLATILSLHPHHGNLGKAFFERRRLQLGAHAPHHVVGHDALSLVIALQTNFSGTSKNTACTS